MAVSSPGGVRPVAVVVFFGLGLVHVEILRRGFHEDPYLGVAVVLALWLAVAGGAALLVGDGDLAWWYALAEGVSSTLGYALTRVKGMPLMPPRVLGGWTYPPVLALGYLGLLLTGLSVWVLLTRHRSRRGPGPVASAEERARRETSP